MLKIASFHLVGIPVGAVDKDECAIITTKVALLDISGFPIFSSGAIKNKDAIFDFPGGFGKVPSHFPIDGKLDAVIRGECPAEDFAVVAIFPCAKKGFFSPLE